MKTYIVLLVFFFGLSKSCAQILGPSEVCAGANNYLYTLTDTPNSAVIQWSHSSSAHFLTGQGTSTVTMVFLDVSSTEDGYGVTDGNSSSGGTLQVVVTIAGTPQTYNMPITFLDDETCNSCFCYDELHINSALSTVNNGETASFQAGKHLSSDVLVPAGSELNLTAGQDVELQSGFETGNSSHLCVDIVDCRTEGKNISPFPFCQTDNNPIGGGQGYDNIPSPSDADILISTFTSINDFRLTIENAPIGSIIYIADQLNINLTGQYGATGFNTIKIPEGVTIASGRGHSSGALIYTDDVDLYDSIGNAGQAVFTCNGNNIRFTGLRFRGPYQAVGTNSPLSEIRFKTGITTAGFNGLEIDNCELYGWPYAAVRFGHGYGSASLENNKMHHNYIHRNRQHGLGYGALIDVGYAQIYSNLMEANRHVIAGTGKDGSGYEAYCNTILPGGVSHNFDMHAEGPNDGTPNAGDFIYIHHNDFLDIGESRISSNNTQNIYIRGRPDIQCRIENNRFKHAEPADAIYQRNLSGGYGNILVWNNIYEGIEYKGWYVKNSWNKTDASNFMNITSSNDLIFYPGTESLYEYDYTFGDYNGDGKTDIYKFENNILYTMPLEIDSNGLTTDWQVIQSFDLSFDVLYFGFFDADNKTDVIYQGENTIFISSGANTSWTPMLSTGYPLSNMIQGDFDGNGSIDLLNATGTSWQVSFNSNSAWQTINTNGYTSDEILSGKFNIDEEWDIFRASGTQFQVSYSGSTPWQGLATSGTTTDQLTIADMNGDNISDVFYMPSRITSLGGVTSWKGCNISTFPIIDFPYGNF